MAKDDCKPDRFYLLNRACQKKVSEFIRVTNLHTYLLAIDACFNLCFEWIPNHDNHLRTIKYICITLAKCQNRSSLILEMFQKKCKIYNNLNSDRQILEIIYPIKPICTDKLSDICVNYLQGRFLRNKYDNYISRISSRTENIHTFELCSIWIVNVLISSS